MYCGRCNYSFCWCCMNEATKHNTKFYNMCPNLPFSFCANISITLLFILFMPAILAISLIVLFFTILYFMMWHYPKQADRYGKKTCYKKVLSFSLFIIILMPLALAGGMIVATILGALALIPIYFLSIVFLVRLCVMGCKTKI